jgi:hypothetical protein
MHAALLPTPALSETEPNDTGFGSDFMITMLDGGLGAVTDPSKVNEMPTADAWCWCGCFTCIVAPDRAFDDDQQEAARPE